MREAKTRLKKHFVSLRALRTVFFSAEGCRHLVLGRTIKQVAFLRVCPHMHLTRRLQKDTPSSPSKMRFGAVLTSNVRTKSIIQTGKCNYSHKAALPLAPYLLYFPNPVIATPFSFSHPI